MLEIETVPQYPFPVLTRGGLFTREWFQLLTALWRRGTWTAVSFKATDFTGSGAQTWTLAEIDQETFAYARHGRTLQVAFKLTNTSVGGVADTELRIALPVSVKAARAMDVPVCLRDNGTRVMGKASVAVDGTYISITRLDGATFAGSANATDVHGQIAFEVKPE
jgi:hypothetical protein